MIGEAEPLSTVRCFFVAVAVQVFQAAARGAPSSFPAGYVFIWIVFLFDSLSRTHTHIQSPRRRRVYKRNIDVARAANCLKSGSLAML